nr:putative Gag-polypeptide of LTR copia-type [Tanacetum cinerariifolium]
MGFDEVDDVPNQFFNLEIKPDEEYIARRALRALRGVVKFQAIVKGFLVKGFLVRKRVAANLYDMQALLRAQLAVRSQKARRSSKDHRLVNLLKNGINPQTQTQKLSDNLQINLKLNNQNYALWTRMIRVAIGGKSKALLSHLISDPPSQDNESYEQWEQEDLIVFSWLIQNIEPIVFSWLIQNIKPTIAGNLTEYPTAKMLWDALVVTYSSGRDKLQTFNLHVKANDIKQNDSPLEELWITLQGTRHTEDQCFKLVGNPDWWNDGHKKGNKGLRSERGKAPHVYGYANMAYKNKLKHEQSWIFDCRATDTMTYDSSDF